MVSHSYELILTVGCILLLGLLADALGKHTYMPRVTALIVTVGLYFIGLSLPIAIILGCISTATAPAATLDVIMESNKRSLFVDRLIAIVALDDLIGLILFSLCLAFLQTYLHEYDQVSMPILIASKEIIGAVILGVLIGMPASYLTGRAVPGQPLLIEALGLIMICGGLAILFDVSYLIAAIVMGAVVANFAKHHEYSFHEIENIEWPIMIIFFTLAGASIQLITQMHVVYFVLLFILFRVIGKILGAYIGCRLTSVDNLTSKWLGSALMPQAGVAIGMSLVATSYLPKHKDLILTIIISATIIFEIFGPIFTRLAIRKVSIQS
jgi:Kef-type K+ transport system membrane component KefB